MRANAAMVAAVSATVLAYAMSTNAEPSEGAEVRRVRSQLDSAMTALSERDPSNLTAIQRAHRANVIETLERYRDAGAFPHNYDFPGQAVPYFVDRKTKAICAVAHLLESTGRRDIVDRIARTNNNVWVPELAADTALQSWLEANGLTLAEAAFIQEPYFITPEERNAANHKWNNNMMSSVALTASSVVALANLWSNRDGHGQIRNALGISSGVVSASFGVVMLADPSTTPSVGIATVAVGALGAYLSTRSVFRHRQMVSAEREAQRARLSVAPVVSPTEGAGVAISLRF